MAASKRLMIQLAVALLGLVAIAEVLIADGPISDIYVPYLLPVVGGLYIFTGLLAWWRRTANGLGSLMTACGVAITTSSFANTSHPVLIGFGAITATLPLSVVIHLVHAAPDGQLRGRWSIRAVIGAYVVGVVLQIPLWAFTPEPPPFDAVLVSPRPDLVTLGNHVQKGCGAVVVVITVVVLLQRLRGYDAAGRRLLASLLGYSILTVVAVAVSGDLLSPLGFGIKTILDLQLGAVAVVPLGFLLVVLRGGFVRPAELGAFAGSVASSPTAGHDLDAAVSAALGDPMAELLRRSGDGYVDGSGRAVGLQDNRPHRAVVMIGDPQPLGAIVLDTSLGTDAASLSAVTSVVAIALEREQLAVEVSASRLALLEASQRLLAAGDAERRRIARDLHDGLQGALVLLSMQAHQIASEGSGELAVQAAGLANGLDAAARSLRDLVDGVMPGPLVERGLAAAVRDLVVDVPLHTEVDVEQLGGRLPTPIETTAYFVVVEGLTNVIKHAEASRAHVRLQVAEGLLAIEVDDNGVGPGGGTGGTGLDGLRDRVAVHGGTLTFVRADGGSRLRATLPC